MRSATYNRERPHQAIGNLTPAERYGWTPPVTDSAPSVGYDDKGEPVYPPHSIVRKVNASGCLGYQNKIIGVGMRWTGARLRILPVGGLVHIYYGEELGTRPAAWPWGGCCESAGTTPPLL